MPKVHRPVDEVELERHADLEIEWMNQYCCPSCEKLIKGCYEWDESPLNPSNQAQAR